NMPFLAAKFARKIELSKAAYFGWLRLNRSLLFPLLRRRPLSEQKTEAAEPMVLPLRYRTQAYVPPGGNHLTATRQYLS
ncbi:hypothetical protein, partial [Alistipes finegoldii]|uniref:hypothetical protein n=1 Tax=Alistipes finegoldii TaxID=214856 RepID=UPI00248BD757